MSGYATERTQIPVRIANGAALSDEVTVGKGRIVGIQMPASWTAAAITFQAVIAQPAGNPPTPTFGEVVDAAGTAISLATPTGGTYMALPDTLALVGLGRIKVRSGTSGAPVNQAAQRDFFLVVVDY